MANSRKAFHFDLDEGRLKSLYPSDSATGYKAAWGKLQAFLEANGFEHTQYSGYETKRGMSYVQAYKVLEVMQRTFPWFKDCAQVATLTEIGRRHDVLAHLAQERKSEEPVPENKLTPSLQDELSDMRRAAQALEENRDTLEPPHRDGHSVDR